MNSEVDIKLRRYRNNMSIGGKGYIIFGIWSVLKVLMQVTMSELNVKTLIDQTVANGTSRPVAKVLIIVLLILMSVIVMGVHLLVGMNAIKFSKGLGHRVIFYISTVIVALFNMVGLVVYPIGINMGLTKMDGILVASILVDLSVVFILVDLFCSAVMVERLMKQKLVEKEA